MICNEILTCCKRVIEMENSCARETDRSCERKIGRERERERETHRERDTERSTKRSCERNALGTTSNLNNSKQIGY